MSNMEEVKMEGRMKLRIVRGRESREIVEKLGRE